MGLLVGGAVVYPDGIWQERSIPLPLLWTLAVALAMRKTILYDPEGTHTGGRGLRPSPGRSTRRAPLISMTPSSTLRRL